jgi:branched-chain amino acid transport system permease protein
MAQIIINSLLSGSLILIVAFLYEILFNVTKFFNIAHASIIIVAPYLVFLFISHALPFGFAVFLAIAASIALSVLLEILIYRRMRQRKFASLNYFIVSVAIYLVMQNLLSLIFGDGPKNINFQEVAVGNHIFGAYVTNLQIVSFLVFISLFMAGHLGLFYTSLGKSIRAVTSNPELSNIWGINSDRVILYTFCIASFLAAVVGILTSMDTYLTPSFGFNLLIYGVAAMIIGGLGSTKNLIAGAFLVAIVQNLTVYYISNQWLDAATYLILILFLVWKPLGLSGNRIKKMEV